MVDKQTFKLANKLCDYHHVNQSLEKSDCILVLGSHDLRVAERGAELYLQGLAPILILSEGLGNFTKEIWDEMVGDLQRIKIYPENLVGEHLIPCCGHHIDHLENSTEVNIQGCFTGINYWVQHIDQNVKLTTESKTEILLTRNEYKNEIKNFVDKVEEFYKLSKQKKMPDDKYDRTGYEMMWAEWKRRKKQMDTK